MDVEKYISEIEANQEKMNQKDLIAREQGLLKGRYVRIPQADGYAFYEIVRENKKTVRIRVITGIGDDWSVSYWGNEATIDKNFAIQNIGQRDHWNDFVQQKRA